VAHTLEVDATDQLHIGELDIFAGRNFVLSVRNRSGQSLLGVRHRTEREPQLLRHGPGFVLYALLDAVVDRYFPIVEMLESELEAIEEQIFVPGSGRANIQQLYALKQRVTSVKHVVSPLLESSGKLWSGRVPPVCERHREYLRDVYDHLTRINTSLDALRDTIGTAIQVNLSMVTIEESETTKRLAAWAGIFAVATAFAGIWGMNFEHMPELKWRYGYPAALGLIVTACAVLYRRFRRAGWL
jgi:magnesium transporter